jgi:hypothetical protein
MSSADRNGNSAAAEGGALHAVSAELAQFRRGELSLEQYVEARVDVATQHLRGRVSKERLEMVREVVRKSLNADPIAQQFIRQLTRSDER